MLFRQIVAMCSAFLSLSACLRREATQSDGQMAASSAFDWGQFIMSVIPVNISDAPLKESDPHICLFEVNWQHDWPQNPKMWSAIYAKHINSWSFDRAYIRNLTERDPADTAFFKALLGRYNVACGASALKKDCSLASAQESNLIRMIQNKIRLLLEKRHQRRSEELLVATEVSDVSVSRSAQYVLLLDRVKKLRPNVRSGKNCLAHQFDLQKEHKRLQEISELFSTRQSIK